jgi:hypothetical protein
MQASRIRLLAATALALGLAAPAGAIDNLTGSWTGKVSCKGSAAGAPSNSKNDLSISVVQTKGTHMRFAAGGVALGDPVVVYVLADATKADRAKTQGLDCGSGPESLATLTMQADVVIKPGSEKGTMKGSLIRRDASGSGLIAVCTFTAKRTSTELPEVPTCPLVEM